MKFAATTAVAAATLFTSTVLAATDVPSIVIKGSKFFYENNGTQFYLRGVAYQQDVGTNGSTSGSAGSGTNSYTDPLADGSICSRDIPYLVKLRTNTIRTYAIDPTKDHSDCMNQLAAAGIYVISDLSEPGTSINRDQPAWNDVLYARYTAVIDELQKYPNVLGFFAGNEVSNQENNTDASAFVKAAVRDSKAYIAAKGYRKIPVGYATNDDASIRVNLADYFNCGDASDAIDFWGYNIYSWCGNSSYTQSGYNDRTEEFESYSVPAFFAEYGCNTVQPREFTEVAALYGTNMSPVWSGGIVYMYFQEANDYGLVSVSGNTVSTLTDFDYFSSEIAKVSPSGVNSASYNPTNKPQSCPGNESSTWLAAATPLPPAPRQDACQCMMKSLSCVANSDVSPDAYQALFDEVCHFDPDSCLGFQHHANNASYGAWSMCGPIEQLSWAFNQYYNQQNQADTACSFGGNATTTSASGSQGSCSAFLQEAGASGTGQITSGVQVSGIVQSTGNGGSGSGSGGSGSSSSSSGAGIPGAMVPSVQFGAFTIGAYVVGVAAVGASMILL